MARALRGGEVSSVELVEMCLTRINAVNPSLNAVVTLTADDARKAAAESDARRARDSSRGFLDGVPATIKDSICIKNTRTTSGAPFLADFVPEEDATCVERLRAAGVVFLGKTNLPVFAGDVQTDNPIFGVTRNPWDLSRSPGGSSGGSAVAVSTGMSGFDIGSDIGGSIRNPAHFCGIYGHKPTFGVVPSEGHIPPPPGMRTETDMGTLGPLARSAEDLLLVFNALADPSRSEPRSWTPNLAGADLAPHSELRIGVWMGDEAFPVCDETAAMMADVADRLEGAGYHVTRAAPAGIDISALAEAYLTLVMPLLIAGYDGKAIAALSEFVRESKDPAQLNYVKRAMKAHTRSLLEFAEAKDVQAQTKYAFSKFFETYSVLICPVMPTPAVPLDNSEPKFARTISINKKPQAYWDQLVWNGAIANFAHLPATARPIQLSDAGLPMGVQIVGPAMADRKTIAFAHALDKVFGHFKKPTAINQ